MEVEKDSLDAYLVLSRPLLTAAYLLQLLKIAYPGGDWCIIFTFDYQPPLALRNRLKGKVGSLYTALLDRTRGFVLDWEWIAAHNDPDLDLDEYWDPEGPAELYKSLMEPTSTAAVKGQWADEEQEQEEVTQVYSTTNGALFQAFLEQYYKTRSDEVPISPISPTTPTLNGTKKKKESHIVQSTTMEFDETNIEAAKEARKHRRETARALLAQTTTDVKIPVTFSERLFAKDRDAMFTFALAVLVLALTLALWNSPVVAPAEPIVEPILQDPIIQEPVQ
jgi:hypothetical protein